MHGKTIVPSAMAIQKSYTYHTTDLLWVMTGQKHILNFTGGILIMS